MRTKKCLSVATDAIFLLLNDFRYHKAIKKLKEINLGGRDLWVEWVG
jgi:hypothetical protein